MARIVIELTNRCNLHCRHCFTGRHGGNTDLPLDILTAILAEARAHGFDFISFTGGDPTVHRRFAEVVSLTAEAGYDFGFVTNGQNFASIYPLLLAHRERLRVVTFSMDGATEATHDQLRGKGSFRRLMQAVSICAVHDLPFTINMVVTAHNHHELSRMASLAHRLGSRGLRFGHLMPSPLTTEQDFDLSPDERKRVEAEIWNLRQTSDLPIAIAPGHYTTSLFPCGPLNLEEINVDCQGNLTKCCHLSGHGPGAGSGDVMGNLGRMSFAEAYGRLLEENARFREAKLRHLSEGGFADTDFFPCWYCSVYYRKVDWLRRVEGGPWSSIARAAAPDESLIVIGSVSASRSAAQLVSLSAENVSRRGPPSALTS